MSDVQSIANKLSQVSGTLSQIQQNGNAEQLDAVLNDLGQLDTDLKTAQAQFSASATESTRQDLVNCRMELHRMASFVSDIRSETAERYRQALGDQKASFEQMEESMQQSTFPEAYQHRQMFKQMDVVSSHLHQLNGAMMDAGYQAGRDQQNGNEAAYTGEHEPNVMSTETDLDTNSFS
ncbi:hypothetical protein [Paenibacillus dakarensis]|uniref:hypothetical protein n=1 Tax=Paenibacillus dakarensis TaxID=1527293 RepID=UPI0006D54163|nr:hypothetical protein [Paenibacillus dakarensis]